VTDALFQDRNGWSSDNHGAKLEIFAGNSNLARLLLEEEKFELRLAIRLKRKL